MEQFSSQLRNAVCLTEEQAAEAVRRLLDASVPVETKAEFLTALAQKGETVPEILAFARELRARAIQPPLDSATRAGIIIDVCGTGGDKLNTFNISTTVALIVASAGVAVAKHGNRAITSKSGSADVLEELGIKIDMGPEQAALCLRDHHFTFLFAPHYHPAFAQIGPARKLCAQKGQRTIFNFLGPLLNPAQPTAQLIGVPQRPLCEPIARVLQALGLQRGMVVSGCVEKNVVEGNSAPHLDELSVLGENFTAEFSPGQEFKSSVLSLEGIQLQPGTLEDLRGGDRVTNAEIVRGILLGRDRSARRDAVLLNTAAALVVSGKSSSLPEGWAFAAELIDSGTAFRKLQDLVEVSSVNPE